MPLTRSKRSLPPVTIEKWRSLGQSGSSWLVAAMYFAFLASAPALAQPPIERVSQNAAGRSEGGRSDGPAVNADGSVVAFYSDAFDLVSGDRNQRRDVFVRDNDLDQVRRISTADGGDANGSSQFGGFSPAISADGCLVTFSSDATNLVADDTNGREDVFLYDCSTESIRRISIGLDGEANGASNFTGISADGRYIVFQSAASNLVDNDTSSRSDIFLFDRDTEEITRVNVASDGSEANRFSIDPAISGDGRIIAFISDATNLVPGDTNNVRDVFVHDRESGLTTRVNVSTTGRQADDFSFLPDLTFDGTLVAFKSAASTLVTGDTNGVPDVFVHDRTKGVTERVSVDSFGNQSQGGLSSGPSISADGRFVVFASFASNFVPGDGNGFSDIFVYDRETKQIDIVSSELDNGRPGGNVPDFPPSVSANGRWIAYASAAENIVPNDINNETDVFLACNPFDPTGCTDVPPETPTITPSPTPTPTPECTDDDDCPSPQVCVAEMCIDPTPTATPPGFCTSNDDCPPNQVCANNMCTDPTPTATPPGFCNSNDDCPPNQVCNNNLCTDPTPTATPPGFCNSNDDCPPNQVCNNNLCTDPTPTATPPGFCNSNDDCPPNQVCNNNLCTDPTPTATPPGFCNSNDDCPPNQVCNNNLCTDLTPTPVPTTKKKGGGGCNLEGGRESRVSTESLALLLLPAWVLWRRRRFAPA
jgi:Tol biopolymer transport system component